MNKLLLTTALIALTALSACKKDTDVASTAPAAGEETTMSAPADASTTVVTTDAVTSTTTSETTTGDDGSVTTSTTTTTTPSEPAQGIAVGEPNPATPTQADANACGTHDDLVGKNVSEVDQSTLSQPVRVYKAGDPVTMDYNANRTNIETDADGKILAVKCG
ncbi:MAG TPA: I78 family peptidase inhibitor [Alphaproteobacteria bacterium]